MRTSAALLFCLFLLGSVPAQDARPNFLLITADDLNYDSVGCYGGKVADATPNIDKLASQGIRFEHGHVTIAVCQPCRSVWMTGRYPRNNGAEGFGPIRTDVTTLPERLSAAGYRCGILGKVKHLAPRSKFPWDEAVLPAQLGQGRSPEAYYTHTKRFLEQAVAAKQPFFLMANSHDPHRPFASSQQEKRWLTRRKEARVAASRTYRPKEVVVPAFLPDIPRVRREIAQYFTSVHRLDDTVGQILRALTELGLDDKTVVMFISDHGMALPFAKTNCYLTSTKVPWIVRFPPGIAAGSVDRKNMISGIDVMPTILELANLKPEAGVDGRSFAPLLAGKPQEGRDHVFTFFHETAAKRRYEMRCIQTRRYSYIFNAWSDGKRVFKNESQSGLSFRAMKAAATSDEAIAARVALFQHRVPEELYDYEQDPAALHNLISSKEHAQILERLRTTLADFLTRTGDPVAEALRQRN